MRHIFVGIAIKALFTVMTIASVRVMSTFNTHAAAFLARQFVKLQIEATLARV